MERFLSNFPVPRRSLTLFREFLLSRRSPPGSGKRAIRQIPNAEMALVPFDVQPSQSLAECVGIETSQRAYGAELEFFISQGVRPTMEQSLQICSRWFHSRCR
jgi:hypothetical protein